MSMNMNLLVTLDELAYNIPYIYYHFEFHYIMHSARSLAINPG